MGVRRLRVPHPAVRGPWTQGEGSLGRSAELPGLWLRSFLEVIRAPQYSSAPLPPTPAGAKDRPQDLRAPRTCGAGGTGDSGNRQGHNSGDRWSPREPTPIRSHPQPRDGLRPTRGKSGWFQKKKKRRKTHLFLLPSRFFFLREPGSGASRVPTTPEAWSLPTRSQRALRPLPEPCTCHPGLPQPANPRRTGSREPPFPLRPHHGRSRLVHQSPGGGHLRHLPRLLHRPGDDRLRPQLLPGVHPALLGPTRGSVRVPRVPRAVCAEEPAAQPPARQDGRDGAAPAPAVARPAGRVRRAPRAAGRLLRRRPQPAVLLLRALGTLGAPGAPAAGRGRGPQGRLEKSLEHLRKQMEDALLFQAQAEETCALWQKMVESQRQNVLGEFERLRRLLAEEEQQLLQKLEEEELEVLPRLREGAARLGQQSTQLATLISELEGRCQLPALGLLQDIKDALCRVQDVKLQPPEVVPMELRTVCRVSGLVETLRKFQGDVTLDPETANPELVLSEDRRSVQRGDQRQTLPDSPERFDPGPCVLGQERFTSGRHYWEVEVGDRASWALGVCRENVDRKEKGELSAGNGFWILVFLGSFYNSTERAFSPLRDPPRRVGIFLDYEAGHLSFYSATDGSLLFIFPETPFSGTLRPLFSPLSSSPTPMTICRLKGRPGDALVPQ